MTEQHGGPDSTSEGREIRHDVVDGGDESLIHDMGDSYRDTAGKGHGKEEAHHGKQSGRYPQHHPPEYGANPVVKDTEHCDAQKGPGGPLRETTVLH